MSNFIINIFRSNKKLTTDEYIVKKTITSFFFLFVFFFACVWAWKWIRRQPLDGGIRGGIQQPIRDVLSENEVVFSKIFSKNHLAKTYPAIAAVKTVRHNGDIGMSKDFDPSTWKIYVIQKNGDTLALNLNDIRKLPKIDIVFNFKCIEGWNQITHWAGVRFSDFLKAYGLTEESQMKYVGLDYTGQEILCRYRHAQHFTSPNNIVL